MEVSNSFKIGITNDSSIMRCRLLIHLIKSCGATPILIPMLLNHDSRSDHRSSYDTAINKHLARVDELLSICDGLIFPGNKMDIHPDLYHASHIHTETQKNYLMTLSMYAKKRKLEWQNMP